MFSSLVLALVVLGAAAPAASAATAPRELTEALAEYRTELVLGELRVLNGPYGEVPGEFPYAVERWRPFLELEFPDGWVDWGLRIIACESRGDPDAKNRRSSAAGLFQFLRDTWNWAAESTGSPSYAEGGPYHPLWNIRNAAWLLDHGGTSHWQCRARR